MVTFYRRLQKFDYLAPKTLAEALALLSQYKGRAMVIAGGTDLVPRMKQRDVQAPEYIIDLKGISELDYVKYDAADGLRLGALATNDSVARSPLVRKTFGFLAEAINKMASVEVRNMGTVAGNLCNAAPSADAAPPLIVLGASVKLAGPGGDRVIPLEEFFTGPGETVLKAGEILTEIQVPNPPPRTGGTYLKLSRTAMDLAVVGVAAAITLKDGSCSEAKIALDAVAPTPMRARKAEAIIRGNRITEQMIEEASRAAAAESRPISDIRASAEYRREMVQVLTKRAIRQAIERARAS